MEKLGFKEILLGFSLALSTPANAQSPEKPPEKVSGPIQPIGTESKIPEKELQLCLEEAKANVAEWLKGIGKITPALKAWLVGGIQRDCLIKKGYIEPTEFEKKVNEKIKAEEEKKKKQEEDFRRLLKKELEKKD